MASKLKGKNRLRGNGRHHNLLRERRAERSPGTFAVSVHNSRDRDVREPIDRIYGLLGLDVSIGAYYRENIVVDYSSSALFELQAGVY